MALRAQFNEVNELGDCRVTMPCDLAELYYHLFTSNRNINISLSIFEPYARSDT